MSPVHINICMKWKLNSATAMTSKFRVPSTASLVLTFLTTESNATSEGLFRGWANVPVAGEDVGVPPTPPPPFVSKFPTDDDSDIPWRLFRCSTLEGKYELSCLFLTCLASMRLPSFCVFDETARWTAKLTQQQLDKFTKCLKRWTTKRTLSRKDLNICCKVDIKIFSLFKDETNEPHRTERISEKRRKYYIYHLIEAINIQQQLKLYIGLA